jgi:hypothetical protein
MSAPASPTFGDLAKLADKMTGILEGMTVLLGRVEMLEAADKEIHKTLVALKDTHEHFLNSMKALTDAQIKAVGAIGAQASKLAEDVRKLQQTVR